jgi:uncharacterized protein (TIGR02266 family)
MISFDKRKHPRIVVHIQATYRSGNLTLDSYATNLSQTGLFLASRSSDPIGTESQVTLSLPGRTVRLSAHVVWCGSDGMGVRFNNLSRDDRLSIANFLIARFCNP